MVARVSTVVFQGVEDVPVEVQVMIEPGQVMMQNAACPAYVPPAEYTKRAPVCRADLA